MAGNQVVHVTAGSKRGIGCQACTPTVNVDGERVLQCLSWLHDVNANLSVDGERVLHIYEPATECYRAY